MGEKCLREIAVIRFSWIISWSFTAVKQLSITYDHLTNNESIVSSGNKHTYRCGNYRMYLQNDLKRDLLQNKRIKNRMYTLTTVKTKCTGIK